MAKKGSTSVVKSTVTIMRAKAAAHKKLAKKAKANLKKAVVAREKQLKLKKLAKEASPKRFTKEELKRFKALIIEKKNEALEELDSLKESMMDTTTGEYVSENSSYSLHMEQGTDAMEREKTFLFASRGSKFVTQLDDALVRIDAGTYGQCRICGLLVPKERLEAVPTAQTCIEYKNSNAPCERGKIAMAKKRPGAG